MDHHVRAPGSGSTREALSTLAVDPLITRDYDARPMQVYERLHQKYGPVAPVDLLGVPVWLALGYPHVLELLQNQRGIWSKRLDDWKARTEGQIPKDWPLLPALEVNHVIFQEGGRLSEFRGAYESALNPFQDAAQPQAQLLRTATGRHADDLIDLLSEGGGSTGWADLSAQYARPLPLMVVNRLLGFESVQGEDALMDMWRVLDAGSDAGPALDRLLAALADLARAKMTNPGDDFPSSMLAARPTFTVDELSRELMMLVGVVGDHTSALICNTAAEVITGNSGTRESLSAWMIRETINRVMLANPPMQNLTFRFPLVDTKLGDVTIAAGEPVMPSVAAAHADPIFAGDGTAEPTLSSRAHLAWGAGPHHCLGRELAITIATVAVSRLFERFSRLRLALPADQLPWRSSPLMRGLRSLPVQYELAAANPGSRPPSASRSPQTPAAASSGTASGASSPSPLWRFLRGLRRGR